MNKCGHQDCFTCPYADCIESARNIQSLGRVPKIDGVKHKTQPKQGGTLLHTGKGFMRTK